MGMNSAAYVIPNLIGNLICRLPQWVCEEIPAFAGMTAWHLGFFGGLAVAPLASSSVAARRMPGSFSPVGGTNTRYATRSGSDTVPFHLASPLICDQCDKFFRDGSAVFAGPTDAHRGPFESWHR